MAGKIKSMKYFKYSTGNQTMKDHKDRTSNRTSDLLTCSAVSQPTALMHNLKSIKGNGHKLTYLVQLAKGINFQW